MVTHSLVTMGAYPTYGETVVQPYSVYKEPVGKPTSLCLQQLLTDDRHDNEIRDKFHAIALRYFCLEPVPQKAKAKAHWKTLHFM